VFVAIDGSQMQDVVLEKAIRIASTNHAELFIGHVVDTSGTDINVISTNELVESIKARMESSLKDKLDSARNDENIPQTHFELAAGPITDTMVEQFIKPFKPDLVICGERGFSSVKYMFVGSVSTYLIRAMDCDVLVVKRHLAKEEA
jgi:nucleotide-binding universal stress UspA family protein